MIHIAEGSGSMRHFFHVLSEHMGRPGPFGAEFANFETIDLPRLRRRQYENWRNQHEDPDSLGYFDDVSDINEINDAAQRLFRYRLFVWSNFFTTLDGAQRSRSALQQLVRDAGAGSVFLLLGGVGVNYPEIFTAIREVFEEAQARVIVDFTSCWWAESDG
jgi:hypothetical protein